MNEYDFIDPDLPEKRRRVETTFDNLAFGGTEPISLEEQYPELYHRIAVHNDAPIFSKPPSISIPEGSDYVVAKDEEQSGDVPSNDNPTGSNPTSNSGAVGGEKGVGLTKRFTAWVKTLFH